MRLFSANKAGRRLSCLNKIRRLSICVHKSRSWHSDTSHSRSSRWAQIFVSFANIVCFGIVTDVWVSVQQHVLHVTQVRVGGSTVGAQISFSSPVVFCPIFVQVLQRQKLVGVVSSFRQKLAVHVNFFRKSVSGDLHFWNSTVQIIPQCQNIHMNSQMRFACVVSVSFCSVFLSSVSVRDFQQNMSVNLPLLSRSLFNSDSVCDLDDFVVSRKSDVILVRCSWGFQHVSIHQVKTTEQFSQHIQQPFDKAVSLIF